MNNNNKIISTLLQKLKDLDGEITDLYKQLGQKILKNAEDPTTELKACYNDQLVHWQKLHDERQFCTENILAIKNNTTRLLELNKFKKEVMQSVVQTKKDLTTLQISFIEILYKDFFDSCPFLFSSVADEIKGEQNNINEASSQIESFTEKKKESTFFAKLSISHKIASQHTRIKKADKKIKQLLVEKADNVQNCTEVKSLYEAEKLNSAQKLQYEKLLTLENELTASDERIKMIETEADFVNMQLTEIGADKNYKKKIESFTDRIKNIDDAIDSITGEVGLSYSNTFYNEQGESLIHDDNLEKQMGEYYSYLQKAASIRIEIAKTKYEISFHETMQSIDKEKNKIALLKRTIQNAERTIEECEKRISDSHKNITCAENQIAELEDIAYDLKTKFS